MRTFISITTLLFLSVSLVFGQFTEEKPSSISEEYLVEIQDAGLTKAVDLSFVSTPSQADVRFLPNFHPASSVNRSEDMDVTDQIIKELTASKPFGIHPQTDEDEVASRVQFKVTTGFFSKLSGGCPNDNTIAVSKSRIISMVNGLVGIYTTSGRVINIYSLEDFFRNHVHRPCDPKVIYDPRADRFFMFSQSCGSQVDNVAMGFSASNDPNGKWYFYIFPSDIDGTGSMSDYPKIGFTKKEVFVSLRIFNNHKWKQTVVYQMDKNDGYSGNRLSYKRWENLPFATTVVRSGVGQYGPGAYLVSTRSGGGSEIVMMDITDNLDQNPQLKKYHIPTTPYELAGACSQLGSTNKLDPGDCRVQDAFYQKGIIHMVFSAGERDWVSVRYHRLNVNQQDGNNYKVIHYAGTKDYTYPSVAPFTSDLNNQTSIVHFQAVGPDSYPEMRGKVFDSDFEYQGSQDIAIGSSSMQDCYNNKRESSRWGDYTGIAFQYHTNPPKVWVSGSISYNSDLIWHTFIAELTAVGHPVATKDVLHSEIEVSPNPTSERLNIYIESSDKQSVVFYLFTPSGKLISRMMSGVLHPGVNDFSFDVTPLPTGYYFLKILNKNHETIQTKKIYVTH